jgi:hypothetical protein
MLALVANIMYFQMAKEVFEIARNYRKGHPTKARRTKQVAPIAVLTRRMSRAKGASEGERTTPKAQTEEADEWALRDLSVAEGAKAHTEHGAESTPFGENLVEREAPFGFLSLTEF